MGITLAFFFQCIQITSKFIINKVIYNDDDDDEECLKETRKGREVENEEVEKT